MQSPGDGFFDSSHRTDDINEEEALALKCPGSIQPHGVLLLVALESFAVRAASANAPTLFGYSCDELFNKSLADLLSADDFASVCLACQGSQSQRLWLTHPQSLSLAVHPTTQGWICEFERKEEPPYFSRLDNFHQTFDALMQSRDVSTLLKIAVAKLSALTGFERAMVYQFSPQGTGAVMAEVKPDDAIAYLGLHFPASDIPEAVREIYRCGPLRYIPDLNAIFQPLHRAPDWSDVSPIDLSHALLRSVDSCCVTYHQNMGVGALMVIPLLVQEQLWGLIALHHSEPRLLPIQIRDTASLFGQALSLALANSLNMEKLAYEKHLKRSQLELIQAFSASEKFEEVLIQANLQILELVQAQGAALCLKNGITLIGDTPDGNDVLDLLRWMTPQAEDCVFSTHQLPKDFAPAIAYKEKASGALLLRVSEQQNFSILWFRAEKIQSIHWAGNPDETHSVDSSGRLGPRQSFARWQDSIRLTASPWLESELENALGLRAAISGIALRKADELVKMNQELERSNEELASFAYAASHDLKEPLRGIYNYTTFLLEDYTPILDAPGIERMNTLLRLTKRMELLIDALLKFSQMRQVDFVLRTIDLQRLLDSVVETLRISRPNTPFEVLYPRPLPDILGDSILLHELFSNLLSNALKYNDADIKTIEIGYLTFDEQQQLERPRRIRPGQMIFYVRDNGIGIRVRHQSSIFRLFKRLHARDRYGGGTGAGLTIVKKIIERHGGDIWVDSTLGEGTTFWFSLT